MAQDIYELFDPYRGDLLYGFAGDRGEFYTHIRKTAPNDCMLNLFCASDKDATAWITVDHYNDSLFGGEKFFVGGTGPLLKQATGVQDEWVKYFWEKLSQHRFSPLGAFTVPFEKRASEGWNDLANDRYYLAIRRGCKFGIEHVLNAASQDAKIRFLLDRFDNNNGDRMVQVTYKMASTARGRTAVSITYSEIRYIYRGWDTLRDRVIFYYQFKKAEAPWEDSVRHATWQDASSQSYARSYKDLWAIYGDERKGKYLAMLEKAKAAYNATYLNKKVEVDQLVNNANGLDSTAAQAKYEQALTLLEPDRAKWKALQS